MAERFQFPLWWLFVAMAMAAAVAWLLANPNSVTAFVLWSLALLGLGRRGGDDPPA
ncbi:MAG: hypothetical protein WD278_15135 [Pirellulales bacterium]